MRLEISVTRFGEILPLMRRYKTLGTLNRFIYCLVILLTHFGIFIWLWANVQCCKWPNIKKYTSHLVRLLEMNRKIYKWIDLKRNKAAMNRDK